MKMAFKPFLREEESDKPNPALGTRASTDIVGAFFQKYGQMADRLRTGLPARPYKDPEIKKDGNDWYIEYQYRVPDDLRKYGQVYRRFRVRKDLNRIRKKKGDVHAMAYAKDLQKIVSVMLESGFNPFMEHATETIENQIEQKRHEAKANDINVNMALNIYMEEKKSLNLSARTITDYSSYLGMFKEYLASRGLLKASILEIETLHIEDYLKSQAKARGWEAATYNTHRDFLSSVFNELIKWSRKDKSRLQITVNPVQGTDSRFSKPSNHRYYTAEYAEKVKAFMKANHPFAFDVCQFIYYTCTRPKAETRFIKLEHIDLERRVLRIPRGKTGYRYVPICDELEEWLEAKEIRKYPGDYYLFGKNGEISPAMAGTNFLTNRYKEVKDALKMSPEYTLYGWKHTRCVDLILSGLSTVEAMQITGHDDVESFEKYLRDMGVAMSGKVTGKTVKF